MRVSRWIPALRGFFARIGRWEAFVVQHGERDFAWSVYQVNESGYANAAVYPVRRGLTPTLTGAKRCAWRALECVAVHSR